MPIELKRGELLESESVREGGAMYTTYRLKANDLNSQFLESLKALFADQEVEITVSTVDETAYLLKSEANSLRLREAIETSRLVRT